MSSMNGLQREAMRGEWSLADAIEVVSRATGRLDGASLICGLREGGRLRYLAYGGERHGECPECEGMGTAETSDGEDTECECCGGTGVDETSQTYPDITLIVNLNGGEVYSPDTHDDLPEIAYGVGIIYPEAAQATIDEYHASLAKPTQVTLAIPEGA